MHLIILKDIWKTTGPIGQCNDYRNNILLLSAAHIAVIADVMILSKTDHCVLF